MQQITAIQPFVAWLGQMIAPLLQAVGQFVGWQDVLIALGVAIASVVIPAIVSFVATMAPDDVESRHYADILRELFVMVNRGRGFDFVVEITDIHELRSGNWQWYEWGDRWDCVCSVCGRVFADTCPLLEICEACRSSLACSQLTRVRIYESI